ncbi:MAG: caspase family protein, partial [Clostridia bacterium]|nr:caspase family protein [Clostridia bacterium]
MVSVGISDYPGDNDLRLPVNDANVITWIYEKNADLKYCKLLNKQATKQNILAAMRQVYRNAQKNDVVV